MPESKRPRKAPTRRAAAAKPASKAPRTQRPARPAQGPPPPAAPIAPQAVPSWEAAAPLRAPPQRPSTVPASAPAAAADPWGRRELLGAAAFITLFLVTHVLVSVAVGESVVGRLFDTAVYAFIASTSMALLGVASWRMRPAHRVAFAAVLALGVFVSMALDGPTGSLARSLFVLLLPLWAVVVVTGPGRFRWSATQFLGATLLLIATWRPLYGSFPDLTNLATAGGVLPSYTVGQLYQIVTLKLFHESVFALAGLFLLFRRFPFVQKVPERGDARAVFAAVRGESRFPLWLTVGLGAFTFTVALFGTLFLGNLLSGTAAGQGGSDDSRVFERMTPELVVFLSFAAGLGEELLFRAILLPAFERSFRTALPGLAAIPLAIVVQAALFGVVHAGYGNLSHVLLPFGFGLLAGVAYRLWGLVPVVYAHTMIDVIAFGSDAAVTRPWVDVVIVVLISIHLFAGLAAFVYAMVLGLQGRAQRRLAKPSETWLYEAPKP